MINSTKYRIGIQIDRLTDCIVNTVSGDRCQTDILSIHRQDLSQLTKKNGWKFSWRTELKMADRTTYKLITENDPAVIHGMMSMSDYKNHYYVHLVESAPFNIGRTKKYEGVAGNLFAYACMASKDRGYEGHVMFIAKTRLVDHYRETLGATCVNSQKMIIYPAAANKLIDKYFKHKQYGRGHY